MKSIFTLLFGLLFASNIFSASVSITGPTDICQNPLVGQYTVEASFPFFCGRHLEIGVSGGTVISIVNSRGANVAIVNPNGPIVVTQTPPRFLPWTVTVSWNNVGCNSVSARVATPGLFCNCDETETLNVQVGNLNPFDFSLIAPEEVTPCVPFTICVDSPEIDCVNSYNWSIGGDSFSSTDNCVRYTITDGDAQCPLGVSVDVITGCGNVPLFDGISCKRITPPALDYERTVCLGERWNLYISGLSSIEVLSSAGNNISQNGNSIGFTGTNLGTIVIRVNYEICGQTVSRMLFINVVTPNFNCNPRAQDEDTGDLKNRLADISQLEVEELKIFPNPVSDVLNFEFRSDNYMIQIYDNSGRLIKQQQSNDYRNQFNVSDIESGHYIIKVSDDNSITTQQFIKL